jgi:hypothetical protein
MKKEYEKMRKYNLGVDINNQYLSSGLNEVGS